MRGISKHIFLESRICLTRGWFLRHVESRQPLAEAEAFRLEQGRQVGELARQLFPQGASVGDADPQLAAAHTAKMLADPAVQVIFEAAFQRCHGTARVDILERGRTGWIIREVKSTLHGGQTAKLIEDVAYTALVAGGSGLAVESCRLLLVSPDFRSGMKPEALFVETEVTEEVQQRLPQFGNDLEQIQEATAEYSQPQARLQAACRDCEFFHVCLGRHLEHPLIEIPRLPSRQLDALVARGIREIKSVPEDFPLPDAQRRAVHCVQTGEDYVAASLAQILDAVLWPAYYLDFETVGTVLPLYPGVAPHEQIPTQFSIHVCDEPGHVVAHHEYLADPTRDCRRDLAELLVQILADRGSVVVYHAPFERGQLAKLATVFPDLAPRLESVIARLFDLKVAIEHGYYHAGFRGSFSIKRVLPVLVPGLTYDGLPIAKGDTAVANFAGLAWGPCTPAEAAEVRRNLLTYCQLDTLAMVRLHSRLLEVSARMH